MRKSSPKEKSHRLHASAARAVLALVVVALLAVPIAVQAELQATNLTYSWDTTTGQLEWGRVTIQWSLPDVEFWIPLLQEIKFDQLDRPDPMSCDDPSALDDTTRWEGWIEYGLPFVDNDPEGAPGFQASRKWHLIYCDLDRDGTAWDDDDLEVGPLLDLEGDDSDLVLADCCTSDMDPNCTDPNDNCRILPNPDPDTNEEYPWIKDLPQDPISDTDEHVARELATRLWISVDRDCDGEVDDGFPVDPETGDPEPLCVYAEMQVPPYQEPVWTFPLPVRISDVNGAKTLMLDPIQFPDAVELAFFSAEPQGRDVVVSWQTATEQDNLGFNLYRTNSAGGERVQLNERLIPSQNLGSSVGSSYQFVDRSAEPDTAYHYWLEDIDMDGVTGLNGPAAVQTPRARLLPCRPRPAPIPPGQIQ